MRPIWANCSMFHSLNVRNYRLFFLGQLVSLVGSWVQIVAQDWLVLELTHNSGKALGTVTALQFAPVIVFTIYGGLLADRLDKRRLLFVVQTGFMLAALGMGGLAATGIVQLWQVYVFAIINGICRAFDTPVRQAFVSELVGSDRIANAISLNSTTFNTARLVGPAAGGVIIAAIGVGPAFLTNGVSFLAVLAGLALIRPAELHRSPPVIRGRGQLREVGSFLRDRPTLLLSISLGAVTGAVGQNINPLLSLFAKAGYSVDAGAFGLLGSSLAIGAVAGALIGTRRTKAPSTTLQLTYGALFGLALAAVAVTPWFWLSALALIPVGVFLVGHNNIANSRLQLAAPRELRGRLMSVYSLTIFGGVSVGAMIFGGLVDVLNVRWALAIAGLAVLATVALLFVLRARRRETTLSLRLTRAPASAPRPIARTSAEAQPDLDGPVAKELTDTAPSLLTSQTGAQD